MFIVKNSLTCEYQHHAMGVHTYDPVIGWTLDADQHPCFQTAYQIVVCDIHGAVLFDTGKVCSSNQYGIELHLKGLLQPMTKYLFKARVWDQDDRCSEWEDSWFLTGFFKMRQWCADWFKISNCFGKIELFRKEFTVEHTDEIQDAFLFFAARGEKMNSCAIYLNGQRAGNSVNFPGATEYFRAFYSCVDVRSMLNEGKNALAFVATEITSLILKIVYKSGETKQICTEYEEWKYIQNGPYTQIGYEVPMCRGKFEIYDARNACPGWTMPDFDDSAWSPYGEKKPVISWGPLFLEPQYCTTQIQKSYKPVNIIRHQDCWFVDFGKNMSGFISFRLKGKPGQTIEIKYAEKRKDNHTRADITGWFPCFLKYTFASDDYEEYTPVFMHTGFRCVEIYGFDGEIDENSIQAHFIYSDVLNQSHFTCSDQTVNLIHTVARRSFLSNLVNIPTDCPERERRGWTADAFAVCEAECVNFNMHTFLDQWFKSMRDCQRGNGWIPIELPLSTGDSVDINWPVACVLMSYDLYEQYADRRFLRQYYEMCDRFVQLLLQICDDDYSICDTYLSFKDWLAIEPATSGFIGMAYFFRCADLMSRLAAILEQQEQAVYYANIADRIRSQINAKYLHLTENGAYYDNGSQSAQAHALFLEICPEQHRAAVAQALTDNIQAKNASTSGFMGTMCLLQALSQNGKDDVAYALLMNRNLGGWIYLLEHCDATTFPENYDGSSSQNHAFLGSAPGLWLYKYLVGISPALPGYKKIRIRPYIPDALSYANAQIETLYGLVSASWEKTGDGIRLTVSVPANTTATVEYNGQTRELLSGQHTLMLS